MYEVKIHTRGKVIIIDEHNQFLLSINIDKSLNEPVGKFNIELAPGITWLELIDTNSYVEIYKRGLLKMMGLVTWVGLDSDIQAKSVRFSIKGSDLGLFFTKYFQLLTNKYLRGWTYNATSLSEDFVQKLASEVKEVSDTSIQNMLEFAWLAFVKIFRGQSFGETYNFSDGESMADKFGLTGDKFFVLADNLNFQYPLYVNFFQEGNITFWGLIQSWFTPHFNEYWMDTADGATPMQIGEGDAGVVKKREGFYLYARPTLYDDNVFDKAVSRKVPMEKLRKALIQKTSVEMNSIYLTVADGAYNVNGAFSSGIPCVNTEALRKYGPSLLEVHVKNAYAGDDVVNDWQKPDSIWKQGSADLQKYYENNDKYLAGTLTGVDINVRIGEKIVTQYPVSNGVIRKAAFLVMSVNETINYMQSNPIPTTTLSVVRGRYIE